MPALLLIKHAAPIIDPAVPAAAWRLSDAGRDACAPLAARVAPYAPSAVITSEEPKAVETGHLLAAHLGLVARAAPGLHEHDRTGVPVMEPAEWQAAVQRFFAHPDERVLGRESAREATARFAAAVDAVLAAHGGGTLAIVAHGTVISLLVAQHGGGDALDLWRQLGMPAIVVVDVPGLALREVIATVA